MPSARPPARLPAFLGASPTLPALPPAPQMLGEIAACGLGPDQVEALWEAYQAAREEEEAMNQSDGGGGGKEKENQVGGCYALGAAGQVGVRVWGGGSYKGKLLAAVKPTGMSLADRCCWCWL